MNMDRDDYWEMCDDNSPAFTGPTEMVICGACNGSGEGMYDGSRCSVCRGSGEIEVEIDSVDEGELDGQDEGELSAKGA